jgi:hypothetical protein
MRQEIRDKVERRMTPAQIVEAQRLAGEWKPKAEAQQYKRGCKVGQNPGRISPRRGPRRAQLQAACEHLEEAAKLLASAGLSMLAEKAADPASHANRMEFTTGTRDVTAHPTNAAVASERCRPNMTAMVSGQLLFGSLACTCHALSRTRTRAANWGIAPAGGH